MELCHIGANQGLTVEIDWNYSSKSRRCRKILIGLAVLGVKTVVVRVKSRISTQNRKNPEMTVPISYQLRGSLPDEVDLARYLRQSAIQHRRRLEPGFSPADPVGLAGMREGHQCFIVSLPERCARFGDAPEGILQGYRADRVLEVVDGDAAEHPAVVFVPDVGLVRGKEIERSRVIVFFHERVQHLADGCRRVFPVSRVVAVHLADRPYEREALGVPAGG